jgi:transposase
MNKRAEPHVDPAVATLLQSSYWRPADASLVLAAWSQSGLSLSAFARRHGIKPKRLWRWYERLGDRSSPAETPAFLPVRLLFAGKQDEQPRGDGSIELVLQGGRRVVVRPGFDATLLAQLVRAVESWSC